MQPIKACKKDFTTHLYIINQKRTETETIQYKLGKKTN